MAWRSARLVGRSRRPYSLRLGFPRRAKARGRVEQNLQGPTEDMDKSKLISTAFKVLDERFEKPELAIGSFHVAFHPELTEEFQWCGSRHPFHISLATLGKHAEAAEQGRL
jgi:hypothetical protein